MNDKMELIEGNDTTRIRKYEYRGHVIVQTFRTHDVRNKTHCGYEWTIEGRGASHTTRAAAKSTVDKLVTK